MQHQKTNGIKSMKIIVAKMRSLKVHRWSNNGIEELSKRLTPLIRGWINYYGKVYKQGMNTLFVRINNRLVKWAYGKYKRFKRYESFFLARKWLRNVAHKYMNLFPHWKYGFKP